MESLNTKVGVLIDKQQYLLERMMETVKSDQKGVRKKTKGEQILDLIQDMESNMGMHLKNSQDRKLFDLDRSVFVKTEFSAMDERRGIYNHSIEDLIRNQYSNVVSSKSCYSNC